MKQYYWIVASTTRPGLDIVSGSATKPNAPKEYKAIVGPLPTWDEANRIINSITITY